jgi:hypothetical protein
MTNSLPSKTVGVLLILEFAVMLAAFLILSQAISWPASLDLPAREILPLVLDKAESIFAGYLSCFLNALILIPIAVLPGHTLRMSPVLGALVMVFGLAAGFARLLGIIRWIVLMPGLAAAYADPAASGPVRDAVAAVYEAFNAYAGGVGEFLGVALFTGIFTILVSVALQRLGGAARWLALGGYLAAALLFVTLLSVVGVEMPILLTVSGFCWHVWAAALGIWHLRQ